jgi:hypothetical protein
MILRGPHELQPPHFRQLSQTVDRNIIVQGEACHQLFQPAILLLQFPQPLCLVCSPATALYSPPAVPVRCCSYLPAGFAYGDPLAEQNLNPP